MNWVLIFSTIIIIFFFGKWVYDSFGNSILEKFGLPNVENKNGLQASAVNRKSSTQ